MTEQILSPGVYSYENDQSYNLPGASQTGLAVVGPSVKGPAFVPTLVNSYNDFVAAFGPETNDSYVATAVKNYFRSGDSVLVTRVLGNGGWSFSPSTNGLAALVLSVSGSNSSKYIVTGFHPSKNITDSNLDLGKTTITGGPVDFSRPFVLNLSGSAVSRSYTVSINPVSNNYITNVIGKTADNSKSGSGYINTGYPYVNFPNYSSGIVNAPVVVSSSVGTGVYNVSSIAARWYDTGEYIYNYNTGVYGYRYIYQDSTNTKLSASLYTYSRNYPTVYRDVFESNYIVEFKIPTSSLASATGYTTANLLSNSSSFYIKNDYAIDADNLSYFSNLTAVDGQFLYLYGIARYHYKYMTGVTSTFSGSIIYDATYSTRTLAYPMLVSNGNVNVIQVAAITSSQDVVYPDYDKAKTPYIISQNIFNPSSGAITNTDLFRFVTLSDGNATNTDVKVSIANMIEYSDNLTYTTFDVLVRSHSDTDDAPSILEQFTQVNLDPNSSNYIAKVIGDKYTQIDSSNRVVDGGDYPNNSKYIRVEVTTVVADGVIAPNLSPRGFRKLKQTFVGFGASYNMAPPIYKIQQTSGTTYSSKVFLGWDYSNSDNNAYLGAIPTAAGAQVDSDSIDFNVDNLSVHPNASISYRGTLAAKVDLTGVRGPRPENVQFSVPFQGGSDGMSPAVRKLNGENITSTNLFGYNLSSSTASGSLKYQTAFNILSDNESYDFNMLIAPGVNRKQHSSVTDAAMDLVETRTDSVYIMDLCDANASVYEASNQTSGVDSNYTATYFPWVKINDATSGKVVSVPCSVVVPQAIAYNDRIGAEWFAPAGLNRGGLGGVVDTKFRISKADRDTLYNARINPITKFPNTGVVIYGQKTLQVKDSALNRVNVRRLLITLRKYISDVSKGLVFEQNTIQTRNKFLSIVNPYLESIQNRQGLYAYRVVMDETNNTADVIDRNQLVGKIYLQPTKTAEYIILEYNIQPTSTTFS
jgi:hypothetical protein